MSNPVAGGWAHKGSEEEAHGVGDDGPHVNGSLGDSGSRGGGDGDGGDGEEPHDESLGGGGGSGRRASVD